MFRESLNVRLRRERDGGSALVAVIGIMVVLTILVVTIVTTSLFNVRMTTETRASVQARAAAEAGVDYVRAELAAGRCSSGTVASPSGSPSFTVTIHPASSGTATRSVPVGCPTPTSKSVLLLATGSAQSSGVGSKNGNTRTVEALIESEASTAPVFNAAIYSGQNALVKRDLTLSGSGADVVTGGNWHCATKQTIAGSVYAAKDVILQSEGCSLDGSVYAGANFICNSTASIGENLYVQGNGQLQTAYCAIGGNAWFGGKVTESRGIKAGGNLSVRGDLAFDVPIEVAGAINVGGKIAEGVGDKNTHYGKFMLQYPAARQYQSVGLPPSGESATSMEFPKIRQDDPMWTGFAHKSWVASTKALLKPYSSMSMCNMEWSDPQFVGGLKITENTVFDATRPGECESNTLTIGNGLTIQLGADAVIFAKSFQVKGDIRVESIDGKDHSLYLVTPHPSTQDSCQSFTGGNSITFNSGTWTQSKGTAVLLYSAGEIEFKSSPKLRGQIYSCKFTSNPDMEIAFVRTGAHDSDSSVSAPALKYLRDVSN